MSAESRLIQALEEMTREYSKNPSKVLKNGIEYNRDRLHRMRAKKGKSKKDALKIIASSNER